MVERTPEQVEAIQQQVRVNHALWEQARDEELRWADRVATYKSRVELFTAMLEFHEDGCLECHGLGGVHKMSCSKRPEERYIIGMVSHGERTHDGVTGEVFGPDFKPDFKDFPWK